MLHHCRAVARGVKWAFLVGDMPFGTYHESPSQAVRQAVRLIQEGHVEAVKMEGGQMIFDKLQAVHHAGIPVLGHIGLTPQSQVMYGGYRVQGKTAETALRILDEAFRVQDAGCFAVVLEAIPSVVAKEITNALDIPTIGIGAGNTCSGQILVQQDMLGMFDGFMPKFCKRFRNGVEEGVHALQEYKQQVRQREFPGVEHEYEMEQGQQETFLEALQHRKQRIV